MTKARKEIAKERQTKNTTNSRKGNGKRQKTEELAHARNRQASREKNTRKANRRNTRDTQEGGERKRRKKRRSWVPERSTLPPFVGSVHPPAPCARPRKAGGSPRPYPLVPRSVVGRHCLRMRMWTHLWHALVLNISCRMCFTLHAPCC